MAKLRAHNIAVSLDGFMAGPDQSREDPLGVGGERLHTWIFETQAGLQMAGQEGGSTGLDNDFVRLGTEGIGATIMGRNMFGPIRGEWGVEPWRGWWGDDPPFHHPVFVLTHHPRPSIAMEGGTTFHFVEGIQQALQRAVDAAGGADVRLGGGAATIRQYLRAGLLDELHVAIVPVLLGGGERVFEDVGDAADGYEVARFEASPAVLHAVLVRSAG